MVIMMEKAFDESPAGPAEGLYISARGLQGRQSVRATFRLPEDIIQLLGVMARQLGLQQKSLFDQLIEDSEVLQQVASTMQSRCPKPARKRQKTFVISKKSLEILDRVARRQEISRDVLVEISIQRLLPIMSAEQEKHRKRLRLKEKMNSLRKQFVRLDQETEQLLGEDDQASVLVRDVRDVLDENYNELEDIIKKGRDMEEFQEEDNSPRRR